MEKKEKKKLEGGKKKLKRNRGNINWLWAQKNITKNKNGIIFLPLRLE